MRKLLILSRALGKGFVRDRASLFFSVVFPLMFLVLFGGVFNVGTLKTSLIEIGKVPLFNAQIKQEYKDAVRFKQYDSRSKAIAQVRKGKYVAAVEQSGNQLVVHYTANDAVQAGSAQGIISAIVGQQNQQASGSPSRQHWRFSQSGWLVAGAVARDRGSHRGSRRLGDLANGFRVWKLHPLDARRRGSWTISHALPLTHANNAMLDTMVRGQAWTAALPHIGLLLGLPRPSR
jgi:hypothetical protein